MNCTEARAQWAADAPRFEALGVITEGATSYLPDDFRRDISLAMDAQPQLFTTPSGGIPAFFTQWVDPTTYRIIFAPNKAAEILGETKKGDWTSDTGFFPVIEHVGEVSSYGDYNNNGHADVNTGFPQRQNYLFQTIKEYGELQLARAGAARLNWVAELDQSAATVMNKFLNYTYFFGVSGLQNYGLLNDPNLPAALTPSVKAWGGTAWISGGQIKATPNEMYSDFQSIFLQLVTNSGGLIESTDELVLAMSPGLQVALTATNSFGVSVYDLLKKNFPNLKIIVAVQYGALTAGNPQGVAAGNFMQLIATTVNGQQTGWAAYSEKMRTHPIIRDVSSYKQKVTGGTWGSVIRAPFAVGSMVGL